MDRESSLDRQQLTRLLELLAERVDSEVLRPEFPEFTGERLRNLFQALSEHFRYCQGWVDSGRNNRGPLEESEVAASLYCDGASRGNPGPSGAGVILLDHNGAPILQLSRFLDSATNNEAEYHALIRGLRAAEEFGLRRLRIFSDSELVVKQLRGEYKVRNPRLRSLYDKAMSTLKQFDDYDIFHVGRDLNKQADRLANDAIDRGLEGGDREKYRLAQRE
jgi:ribonuclease HI